MALIRLQNIGKIYASEGSVAVGIRGVSLSFDRGEFVAVTGKSGSGKSTLLNVISGMDSYEEGELFIEGRPTSHYLQKDWEDYREKYISFIFQNYNIIDSFTVLQNVELALMGIEDLRERRRRAVELIKRVGLYSHIHHKGSKLSGGQKQRTVIARALAKDSPVILADEPTGNLDSQSSAEIIELLREVSADKLVIVVTHSFEQLAGCATRHVRIFDGAVESDQILVPGTQTGADGKDAAGKAAAADGRSGKKRGVLRNGIMLGGALFTAKPRLTFFMCLLLVVASMGIYLVSSLGMEVWDTFGKHYMFEPEKGRLIAVRSSGEPFTDKELAELASRTGASGTLHYDFLLDNTLDTRFDEIGWDSPVSAYVSFACDTEKKTGGKIYGRLPEKAGECLLCLPVAYRPYFGTDERLIDKVTFSESPYAYYYDDDGSGAGTYTYGVTFTVCGVCYFADNNKSPRIVLTSDGFRYATILRFILDSRLTLGDAVALAEGEEIRGIDLVVRADLEAAEKLMETRYCQASLFYANDREAERAASALRDLDIIAVPSSATYQPEAMELIEGVLSAVGLVIFWTVSVLFLAFFVRLCTSKSVSSFRPDMGIMRSMGIPVAVIRTGIYVRMFLCLIPSFAAMAVLGILVATVPAMNAIFRFLYAPAYIGIAAGMVAMVLLVTRMQIRRLFGTSVREAIRGGERE